MNKLAASVRLEKSLATKLFAFSTAMALRKPGPQVPNFKMFRVTLDCGLALVSMKAQQEQAARSLEDINHEYKCKFPGLNMYLLVGCNGARADVSRRRLA
jgi:hypothetical protein